MTDVAVMQPAYLPWCGWFDLLDQADVFVLLDSVQFSRQSWQHRNRIRTPDGLSWLTVPVRSKGLLGTRIDQVMLGETVDFPHSHAIALRAAYGGTPGFSMLEPVLARLDERPASNLLVDVTVPIIATMATVLEVPTQTVRSSELPVSGRRSELIIALCRHLGADRYLTPPGALGYLAEDAHLWADAGIEVLVQHYEHPTYQQRYEPFVPYASAIDAIACCGSSAPSVVRAGRRDPVPLMAALEASRNG